MKQFLANIIPPKNEYLNCLYGFLLFLLLMPYFLWSISNVYLYVFLLIVILNIYNFKKKITELEIISIIGLTFFYLYATQYKNLNGIIIPLLFLTFLVAREKFILSSFGYFKFFFALSLGLSLVFFLLHACSVSLPYEQIKPLNKEKIEVYYQYPFFVITDSLMNNIFPRFFGMFDEPGIVGTFAGIILFMEKYKFSKQNLIFFITGLISFSFYFMLLTILGLLIFTHGRKRVVFILVFISLFLLTKSIPIVDTLVWKRAQIEDGRLAGDNRTTDSFDLYYKAFVNSPDFLWGRLSKEAVDKVSASYKQLVINYGLIFCLFYLFILLLLSYSQVKNWKYVILCMILILTLLYQRPFIFSPIYFFVCYIPMITFKLQRN